ncbi:MAG: hypothetical protein ABUT39_17965 [Acidobacteriota bacterium]
MATKDGDLAEHVCEYSIALLPGVKEEAFEAHLLKDVLPHFELTWRPVGAFRLEHRLLKQQAGDRADRYRWQIRFLSEMLVAAASEESMLAELDKRVRDRLDAFGIPVSRTILRELGAAQTL